MCGKFKSIEIGIVNNDLYWTCGLECFNELEGIRKRNELNQKKEFMKEKSNKR